ncbi:MAG: NAD(P)/FAD-dependent oxidoreductase [Gemmatimonadota bacterium]
MATSYDAIVIGGGTNGLVTATVLAKAGKRVVVLEANDAVGGGQRALEFAPGFRADPVAPDAGWISPAVAAARGLRIDDLDLVWPEVSAPAPEGGMLTLSRDVAKTQEAIRRFSAKDAERWPAFTARVHRIAEFLGLLYGAPAPDVDTTSLGELFKLAGLGLKLRGLGKTEMIELLRNVPMAVDEFLDEWFESDLLKALIGTGGVNNLQQGPRSGGTTFVLLHHHVGNPEGAIRTRPVPRAGMGLLTSRLLELARGAGVEIRTGASVQSILVRTDTATGVVLTSGEEVGGRAVISSADPFRTLLVLLDPVHLDPELIHAVRQIKFRGVAAKVLLALDGLPDGGSSLGGIVSVAPSLTYVEKASDHAKYGRWSPEPWIEIRVPTVISPADAPAGKHAMVVHAQYAPYHLRDRDWSAERERFGDAVVATLERAIPGLAARIQSRTVLTPKDLESRYGYTEGAISQGELTLDQILFMRPVAGWARYQMPVPGLFLCGAGTHPGGGITGGSGLLAAREVLGRKA